MTILGVIVFMLLAAVAMLHAAWGFGARFPARNEPELVALVVGETGRSVMPSRAECLVAAAAIFAAAVLALLETRPDPSPLFGVLVAAAGIAAAVVFLLRGLAAYMPGWRRRFSLEPFATIDRRAYGPLCLCLAAVFALLSLNRLGVIA